MTTRTKRHQMKGLTAALAAGLLLSAGTLCAQAESENPQQTVQESSMEASGQEAGADAAAAGEQEGGVEEVLALDENTTLTLINQTGKKLADASWKDKTLVLKEENGTEHRFEKIEDLSALERAKLTEGDGFFFIGSTDADGKETIFYETADEKKYEKSAVMYTLSDVNIRAAADQDAEVLSVAACGGEVEAVGAYPAWVEVKTGDGTGFISRPYLTSDQEEARKAQEKIAAEAAADEGTGGESQAADNGSGEVWADDGWTDDGWTDDGWTDDSWAGDAWAGDAAGSDVSSGADAGAVTEVGREAFDDCDGSGHGYYVVTYSDGSTQTVDY